MKIKEKYKNFAWAAVGFAVAHFSVLSGFRVVVNGFHLDHLYLGLVIMLLGYIGADYFEKKVNVWRNFFYFGAGIFINDLLIDLYLIPVYL